MNNCKECKHKANSFTAGHCYMFKHEPKSYCAQFKRLSDGEQYRRSTDEPRTHSDGGGTSSSFSYFDAPSTSSSSDSFSSGGGDSGGGGSSGDW